MGGRSVRSELRSFSRPARGMMLGSGLVATVFLLFFVACSGGEPPEEAAGDAGQPAEKAAAPTFIVMTVNVGNADVANCKTYGYKLCRLDVERRLARGIARHKPHLIALQEVFPSRLCKFKEEEPGRICHEHKERKPLESVRRILGDEYTIACEDRSRFECVAVRRDSGKISGCEDGALCYWATVPPPVSGCEKGFSVSAVKVRLGGVLFNVVNLHPDSRSKTCRKSQLAQVFEGDARLVFGGRNLVLGDSNLDPFRDSPGKDPSVELWNGHVGEGKLFRYHSGVAEKDPPYHSSIAGRTIDHVVSDFASGSCVTLGKTPGTSRLDGKPPTLLEGLDHFALKCELKLK